MAENSKIEWCDHTFNPWIGCTKVSDGCKNCYAERDMDIRRGRAKWGPGNPRSRTSEKYWKDPIKWNKKAKAAGRRDKVFCASLADVFDPEVPEQWRADLFGLILDTPHLDWLLLTKRPEYAQEMMDHACYTICGNAICGTWPDNIWLGVSVEDQEAADKRIRVLLEIDAAVHFLSAEPLLGPLDLSPYHIGWLRCPDCGEARDPGHEFPLGSTDYCTDCDNYDPLPIDGLHLHWVIVGGESGPGARPMRPDWARSLRDQCQAAGIPFFFKQWGAWAPESVANSVKAARSAIYADVDGSTRPAATGARGDSVTMQRVGKKAAGRMLDGREWNEFPATEKEAR